LPKIGVNKNVPFDVFLFAVVLALMSIGLIMVLSASYSDSLHTFADPYHYIKRQLVWAVLGITAMLVVAKIDYRHFRPLAIPGLLLAAFLLALVLVIGSTAGGGKRWIDFGPINMQPSEIAKVALINFLAAYVTYKKGGIRKFFTGLLPALMVIVVFFRLILLEPDFGTAMALVGSSMIVLFAGGINLAHVVLIGTAAVPALVYLVMKESYRMKRILSFFDPWKDPLGAGWNVIQSLYAIGSGGIVGLGLGNSRQKFSYLPEPHTDFIFAVLAEELGFIGTFFMVVLYFLFTWRSLRIAILAPDLYGSLLAVGITAMIIIQAMLNMGVVTGSLPVTGITLPFISLGGSSLFITLASVGVLLNISRSIKKG
jgi:cell division protein FtsW